MRPAAAALAALLAAPAAARAHSAVEGDGRATTERRDVPAFDAIDLEGATDVEVRVGGERAVSVTIDGNLQRHLLTEVRRGKLVISSEGSLRPRTHPKVQVTVPSLRGFELSGSGDVSIDGGAGALELAIEGSGDLRWKGEATDLRSSIDGSGDLHLEGRADRLNVSVEGSGDVDAGQLVAKDVAASVDGSGNVLVNLSGGSLTAAVSGSGDIRWKGDAKVESVTVSGSGRVGRKD